MASDTPDTPDHSAADNGLMPTEPFGSTGHHSSRILFGAAALGSMSPERADTTLAQLLPTGVNHIDTAASYGDSEDRLKPFLADHRQDFFLATKTGDRSGDAARASLEKSLERMGVDSVDLIQLHNLVEDDEWTEAFRPGGAVEAIVQARSEGLCRFIGVTGHGVRIPGMHLRSLGEFNFDSVLFPFNFSMMSSPDYRSDVEALVSLCQQRGVAMQTIKSIARRRWMSDDGPKFAWYEPLAEPDAIANAVGYVLGHDTGGDQRLFVNSSSDARLLPLVLNAARSGLAAPSHDVMVADHERFAITPLFDGSELERI